MKKAKKEVQEKSAHESDVEKHPLSTIVTALEFLKDQALRENLEDAAFVIEAAFKLCLSMYYLDLRGEYIGNAQNVN